MALEKIIIGAKEKLRTVAEKINAAIDAAERADTTATEAKATADQTRTEFNQITNNDTSALGGQLSVGGDGIVYPDAQERFIQEHNEVTSLLAQTSQEITNLETNKADKTEVNSLSLSKAEKSQADNIQNQVNSLVLGAVGDGNNAEVVQMRGQFPVANDRLNNIEYFNGIINPSLTYTDGFMRSSDLTIADNTDFQTSNHFYVAKNSILRVKVQGYLNNVSVVTQTDENGNPIKLMTNSSSDYVWYEFNITEDSYYRVSGTKNPSILVTISPDTEKTISNSTTMQNVIDERINTLSFNSGDFYKVLFSKVLCIGDSITKGVRGGTKGTDTVKSYPSFLSKLSDWECVNGGEAGFTAQDWFTAWSDAYITSEYDAFIIKLGQNGGLTDTIATDCVGSDYTQYADTQTGNYCKIIERIKERNPTAKIFLVSIRSDAITTNSVIQKIATKYDLPYVNLADYNINLDDVKYHQSETGVSYDVHFNTTGYMYLSHAIYKGMLSAMDNRENEYIDF